MSRPVCVFQVHRKPKRAKHYALERSYPLSRQGYEEATNAAGRASVDDEAEMVVSLACQGERPIALVNCLDDYSGVPCSVSWPDALD